MTKKTTAKWNRKFQQDDEIVTCPSCQKEVIFLEKKPDDIFNINDMLYIALWIIGTSFFVSSHWIITVIISFLVVTIYYLANTDVYCPKCSTVVSDSNGFFLTSFILIVALYFLNMIVMVVLTTFYGGDAYYGSIIDGHYYLGYGTNNAEKEVPWFVYHFSLFGVKLHFFLAFLIFASIVKGAINKRRS